MGLNRQKKLKRQKNHKNQKPATQFIGGQLYSPDLLPDTLEALRTWDLSAKKKLSQNFLVDSEVFKRIIKAADLRPEDQVMETGPGLGYLTQLLAAQVKKVVAVEYDQSLSKILASSLATKSHVTVIFKDALDVRVEELQTWFQGSYKIVANLPYAITGAYLRKYLATDFRPQSFTLLLQKEVAERICAKTGQMNLLALSVQVYGQPRYVETVPKEVFYPSPKVDSAILHVNCEQPTVNFDSAVDETWFWRLAHIGFSSPRKVLVNNLAVGLKLDRAIFLKWLDQLKLSPKARPQELSLEAWVNLSSLSQKQISEK